MPQPLYLYQGKHMRCSRMHRPVLAAQRGRRCSLRRRIACGQKHRGTGGVCPYQRARNAEPSRKRSKSLERFFRRQAVCPRFNRRGLRHARANGFLFGNKNPRAKQPLLREQGRQRISSARAYFETYGFPAIVTRCSNNYGPLQFPEKLIPLMIINAMDGHISLPVYGNGLNIRDWPTPWCPSGSARRDSPCRPRSENRCSRPPGTRAASSPRDFPGPAVRPPRSVWR